jgi:hypothetical protein
LAVLDSSCEEAGSSCIIAGDRLAHSYLIFLHNVHSMTCKKNKTRGICMKNAAFSIANLEEQSLKKLQQFEKTLREETGEEIVLIAYNHKKK